MHLGPRKVISHAPCYATTSPNRACDLGLGVARPRVSNCALFLLEIPAGVSDVKFLISAPELVRKASGRLDPLKLCLVSSPKTLNEIRPGDGSIYASIPLDLREAPTQASGVAPHGGRKCLVLADILGMAGLAL